MRKQSIWLLIALLSLLLGGCGMLSSEETPAPQLPGTPTNIPTGTPADTTTPLAPVGVLLSGPDVDPVLREELAPMITEDLKAEGLRFQQLQTMKPEDFQEEEYRLVVVLPPYPELTALAASAPEVKFLAVGFRELQPAANLSVLRPDQSDYGVQGFIAGYIAAVITPDWRVGAVGLDENEKALAAREGFVVGAKYFCGLCNPKYAPTGVNYLYPKYVDLPPEASQLDITANVKLLLDRAVQTFYITPGAGDPVIYDMLIEGEARIIGPGSDFREEYRDHWVASLEYDLTAAYQDSWPEFLGGEVGEEFVPPLLINDVNQELLSPGKLLAVEDLLTEVSAGYISTTLD